jgi:hypothetical protein
MQRPDIMLKVSKPVPGDIVLHARVSITNQVPPRKRVLEPFNSPNKKILPSSSLEISR